MTVHQRKAERNAEIIRLAAEETPYSLIAVQFGISEPRVSQIVHTPRAAEPAPVPKGYRKAWTKRKKDGTRRRVWRAEPEPGVYMGTYDTEEEAAAVVASWRRFH